MQFSIFVTGKMAPLTGAQRQKRYREQLRRENPYINTRLKQLASQTVSENTTSLIQGIE